MNIKETVLKELFIETYKELVSSPLYKRIKLNSKDKIEYETIHNKLKSKSGADLMKDLQIGLEKFIEDYGDTVQNNIKKISGEEQETRACKNSEEIKVLEQPRHEYIYRYIYLQNRLNIIEVELKNFSQKPVIDKDNSIVFVEIK